MKFSFKEIIVTEAYQRNAEIYAKAMISASTLTIIVNYFLTDTATLIGVVLLLVGWSLMGVSILVALPCYALFVWLISKMSAHVVFVNGVEMKTPMGHYWKIMSSLWKNISFIINIYLTIVVSNAYWS
jgi:hypothetical protein